jgi:hypothetical protein
LGGQVNTEMGHPIPADHDQHRIFAQSRTGLRTQIGVTALLDANNVVSRCNELVNHRATGALILPKRRLGINRNNQMPRCLR